MATKFNLHLSLQNGLESLGNEVLRSRAWIRQNKNKLETPTSLNEYQDGFPPVLKQSITKFVSTIQKAKHDVKKQKRQQRNY